MKVERPEESLSVPPPPCDTCPAGVRLRCARERLACEAFAAYLGYGRPVPARQQVAAREPSRRLYVALKIDEPLSARSLAARRPRARRALGSSG